MVSIIVAIANNNVIGKRNDLPWYLPEDLKHFKKVTFGHPVLMGRNTYLSIVGRLGKPLPGRTNIVVSFKDDLELPAGVKLYTDLSAAIKDFADQEVFVIGGASIYEQAIQFADKLYITRIRKDYEGDVFFPAIDEKIWQKVTEEPHEGYSFQVFLRNK